MYVYIYIYVYICMYTTACSYHNHLNTIEACNTHCIAPKWFFDVHVKKKQKHRRCRPLQICTHVCSVLFALHGPLRDMFHIMEQEP